MKAIFPDFVTYVESITDLLLHKLNDSTFTIPCNLLYCNVHLTILKRPDIYQTGIWALYKTKNGCSIIVEDNILRWKGN